MVGAYLVGIHPRSEELIKKFRDHAKGKLSKDELMDAVKRESKEIVNEQVAKGFTYIIDGMLSWHDLLRPFTEELDGVKTGGLTRWFDNNMFYRQPIITGPIERKRPFLKDRFLLDILPKNRSKVVVPDPLTFAYLSEDRYYKKFEEVLLDFSEILALELRELSYLGVSQVQLSSPVLVIKKHDKDVLTFYQEAIEKISKSFNGNIMMHTFFGKISNALPDILNLRIDTIGIDFSLSSVEEIQDYDIDKSLAAGCVDARNSLIEAPKDIVMLVKNLQDKVNTKDMFLVPSCDLEYLPQKIASMKMESISKALDILGSD